MASASIKSPTVESKGKPNSLPVQMNLNLYNFDNADAQSCPYVLTSPRSLEACSNLGIKPVELLHKTLSDFEKESCQECSSEQVLLLYQEHEQKRLEKLEKCRSERKNMIKTPKTIHRSLSASPLTHRKMENEQRNRERASFDNRLSFDDTVLEETEESQCSQTSQQDNMKSKHNSSKRRNLSWSAPTSPFRSLLVSSLVPITSPALLTKLKDSPRVPTKLPSKDIKLMELMVQRHQAELEEEELRACAQQLWYEEHERTQKQQQTAERERWQRLNAIQRDELQARELHERLQQVKEKVAMYQQQKRLELLEKEAKLRKSMEEQTVLRRQKSARSRERSEERKKIQEKRLEEQQKQEIEQAVTHLTDVNEQLDKASKSRTQKERKHSMKLKLQNQKEEDKRQKWKAESMQSSMSETEFQIEVLSLKDKQLELRKHEITLQRENSRQSCEERQKLVRLNQQELDHALARWRDRVASYQEEANYRAALRAAESIEIRRSRAREGRRAKETEHKKNLERVKAEEEARHLEMLMKIVDKEKQSESFISERQAAIEKSRSTALASSDLRDHLRQKFSEDSIRQPRSTKVDKDSLASNHSRRDCSKDLRRSRTFFC